VAANLHRDRQGEGLPNRLLDRIAARLKGQAAVFPQGIAGHGSAMLGLPHAAGFTIRSLSRFIVKGRCVCPVRTTSASNPSISGAHRAGSARQYWNSGSVGVAWQEKESMAVNRARGGLPKAAQECLLICVQEGFRVLLHRACHLRKAFEHRGSEPLAMA